MKRLKAVCLAGLVTSSMGFVSLVLISLLIPTFTLEYVLSVALGMGIGGCIAEIIINKLEQLGCLKSKR